MANSTVNASSASSGIDRNPNSSIYSSVQDTPLPQGCMLAGTIRLIRSIVEARHVRSVRACVLLRKQIPAALATKCEYVGFDIPDEFVVGYGLDLGELYRNLPCIAVYTP